MYIIWLQGFKTEGYYRYEENGSIHITNYVPDARKFPSESAARDKAFMLMHDPDVMSYEIVRYRG